MADDGRGTTKFTVFIAGLLAAVTMFGFVMYSGVMGDGKALSVKVTLPAFPSITRPVTTGSGSRSDDPSLQQDGQFNSSVTPPRIEINSSMRGPR
jgi:hypothetical protein